MLALSSDHRAAQSAGRKVVFRDYRLRVAAVVRDYIAAERCNVPVEKCHMIMQKYGYTGSAGIPMAMDDAIELGKIKRGDLVVMIQSGLGWNQAAAAIRMTPLFP